MPLRTVHTLLLCLLLLLSACGAPGGGATDEADAGIPAPEGEEAASGQAADPVSTEDAAGTDATEGEVEATDDAPGGAADGEPLAIGFIAPLSGPLAGPGQDMLDGFNLWLEQNGTAIGGRPVELSVEDTAGNPDTGIQVTRRLVQQVGVDVVVGPLLGNVGLAVGDFIATTDTPLFYPIPSSEAFLRALPETMFVSGGTAAQDSHVMGQYAFDQGHRRVLAVCQDYAFGHELCGGFTNVFTDLGGEVVETIWAPLGTADYGPFVSQIQGREFDVVYSGIVGADSIKFVQAWNDFGLAGTAPFIASLQPLDQSLVRAMGEGAAGMVSSGHFAEGRDAPATAEFVTDYEEAFDKIPSYYSASGHLAAQWIDQALVDTGGDIADTDSFLEAVRAISFDDSAFGPVSLDEHGNVLHDVYIREVVQRDDGTWWNEVIEKFEGVGPTFHYDYDTYLAQPVYSRDYQGVDWPENCDAFADDCPLDQ